MTETENQTEARAVVEDDDWMRELEADLQRAADQQTPHEPVRPLGVEQLRRLFSRRG